MRSQRWAAWGALLALLAAGGCKKAKLDEDHLIEKPLGAMSKFMVELQYRQVRDPLMVSFVEDIGQSYLHYVRRENVPYDFNVVDAGSVNAFAIPWGGIYIHRGLLEASDTEDELAFVMGHEIGHVEGRHSVKRFKNEMLVALGLSAIDSRSLRRGLGLGSALVLLKYGRDQELDADERGAEFSYQAAYDPRGGIGFFDKLLEKYGDQPRLFVWLSTHPLNRDRINRLERYPQLDFDTATVNRRVAGGYLRRGMFHQAQELYLAALKRDSRDVGSYAGLAQAAARLGQPELANAALERAVALDPGDERVRSARQALSERPAIAFAPRPLTATPLAVDWEALEVDRRQLQAQLAPQQEQSKVVSTQLGDQRDGLLEQLQVIAGSASLTNALNEPMQEAEKVLILAGLAMAELLAAQEQSADALQWIGSTRAWSSAQGRGGGPGDAWRTRAYQDAQSGLRALTTAIAEIPDALASTGRTVQEVQRAVAQFSRGYYSGYYADTSLAGLERRLDRSMARAAQINELVSRGRGYALQGAINAILSHADEGEQAAVVPLVAHLLRTEESEVVRAWQEADTPADAALAVAGAKSSRLPVAEVSQRAVASQSWMAAVEQTEANLWAVEVGLHILAKTLEREIRPDDRAAIGKPEPVTLPLL